MNLRIGEPSALRASGYYNGFGPKKRTGVLAALEVAMATGAIAGPTHCSACGNRPSKPLDWHSEDYRRPLDAFPICTRCHYALHIRFHRPAYWQRYISGLDPVVWCQYPTVDPSSLRRPFDETYPEGLPGRRAVDRETQPCQALIGSEV